MKPNLSVAPVSVRSISVIEGRAPRLQKLLSHDAFPIVLALLLGLLVFRFGERVPVNDGFGWDGATYASWARNFPEEIFRKKVNEYYIQRILPSAVIHYSLKAFRSRFTTASLHRAYGFYAVALLGLGAFFWGRIARNLELTAAGKWLGFVALFLGFIPLKYAFYCPANTDLTAYTLGLAMLSCYLRRDTLGLALATLIGAFTWPLCIYSGGALLVFPRGRPADAGDDPPPRGWPVAAAAAIALAVAGGMAIVYQKPPTVEVTLTDPLYLTPAHSVLGLSILAALLYTFLACWPLLSSRALFSPLRLLTCRSLSAFGCVAAAGLAVRGVQMELCRDEGFLNLGMFLSQTLYAAVVRPGVFAVTHVAFFGPIVLLLALFWRSVCREIHQVGVGLTLCALMAVLLSLNSQSRFFISLFPMLAPFAVKAAMRQARGLLPLWVFTAMTLLLSRAWYAINAGPFQGQLFEFPDQGLFMSMGPWISPLMYAIQGGLFAVLGVILYSVWFRGAPVESWVSAPTGRPLNLQRWNVGQVSDLTVE